MKKYFLVLLSALLLCGCEEKKEVSIIEESPSPSPVEEVEKYEDLNKTPIGLYSLQGNKLVKLHSITITPVVEEDIGIFQTFPSNEEEIYVNNFGEDYYNLWNKYKEEYNVKLGFNLKFHLINGESISYNILYPWEAMNKWEWLMNYLYDDYANRGKSFYSHIENEEYNDETLFTSIKLQNSYQINEIDSNIELTVFTYDTDDDFDINGEYRGNSKYTFEIVLNK